MMALGQVKESGGGGRVARRTWDAILVAKGLELAVGPSVENPFLDAGPSVVGSVLSLVPVGLDLGDEAVLSLAGLCAGVLALGLEVGA